MFTDNKDFYPTPKNLINKMLKYVDLHNISSILEPSAGTGNLVEALNYVKNSQNRLYTRIKCDFDCIEKDNSFRAILSDKGFRVIADDFLTFHTFKRYDLIFMNPPFSNGCKHLLKAIELQEMYGGKIVCLLNAETLKNPFSNERKHLCQKMKDYNATVEFISEAFIEAERVTDVETALVYIEIPSKERKSFIFDKLQKAKEKSEYKESESTDIINGDFLKGIVDQFNFELEAGIELIKEYNAMKPYILSDFTRNENGETVQCGGSILSLNVNKNEVSVNDYIRATRKKYWKALFNNPDFIGKLTVNLQNDFRSRVDDLQDYDFSMYNISQIRLDMQKNMIKGIEDTIIDLFDEFSNKYCYDEYSSNIHYYNGWKTNKSWIINKKIVIKLNGFDNYSQRFYPTSYQIIGKLKDIEKCFNYLDGGLTEAIDLEKTLRQAEDEEQTKNIVLKYFNVTFYKKGTCHIVFTNEELLKKFNIFGSQHRGWLPPSYGKKKYSEMESEEQEVINNFSGKSDYEKVMMNTKYYIFNPKDILMLEEK